MSRTPYDYELAAIIDAEHYADDLATDARFEAEDTDTPVRDRMTGGKRRRQRDDWLAHMQRLAAEVAR